MKYKRIIIKLSGEGLKNPQKNLTIDFEKVKDITKQIKKIQKDGIEIGIVIGGGNFWRGASAESHGINRHKADYIGMLATIMNALALQNAFEKAGIKTIVQSAINIDQKVAENYSKESSVKYLKTGYVVIFAGGIGRPYFTTDTTATLVALEIQANVILMAKNGVDGVYTNDPKKYSNAKKIHKITFTKLLKKDLGIIDETAIAIAKKNDIDLLIFNIQEKESLVRVIKQEIEFTLVSK